MPTSIFSSSPDTPITWVIPLSCPASVENQVAAVGEVLSLVPSSDLLRTLEGLKWQESFPLFIMNHFLLQVSLCYTVMGQGPWEISGWVSQLGNVSPFCLHQQGGDGAAEGTSYSLKVKFWKRPDWGKHPSAGKVFHFISWDRNTWA